MSALDYPYAFEPFHEHAAEVREHPPVFVECCARIPPDPLDSLSPRVQAWLIAGTLLAASTFAVALFGGFVLWFTGGNC
jgi:hypothetical protein